MSQLSTVTEIFSESQSHGLLVCGTNFGLSKEDERLDAAGVDRSDPFKSFFSDKRVNSYRYRDTIVKWFGLWRLPLEQDEARAGALERSIVQTNWLPSVSNNLAGKDVVRECIEEAEGFLGLCERLRPRLVLLIGSELASAIAAPELRKRVEQVFGSQQGHLEQVEEESPGVKSFRISRLRFDGATVLCLPHATGTWGLSDQFIAAQDAVKAELAKWWAEHQKYLKSRTEQ